VTFELTFSMGYWSMGRRGYLGGAAMNVRTFGMNRKNRWMRWLVGMAILALAECAGIASIELSLTGPAMAQRDDRYPFASRQRRSSGGFFQQLFGGRPQVYEEQRERESAPVDNSRAPPPHKADAKSDVEPTTSIVVMGDGMADWLAYGLEDAFADSPEVGIVRESKARSGLLRYDNKSDLDWWDTARDILSKRQANYVVMMLGVSDRQNIREKDIEKEAEKNEAEKQAAEKQAADKNKDGKPDQAAQDDEKSIIAPEPKQTRKSNGVVEFRSDQWEKVYSRRIDQTIAALKSKGVPVFWVGLPSIRGTRSTADAVYLNDLYRARAERAGVVYIDVWDGFVDEAGKYATYGPDYEGQTRRLRSGDGVFFSKYGARKLAHYVEREIRRYMSNRGPLALPLVPTGPVPADGKPMARPLAGPVVPLTMMTGNADALLGGGSEPQATRPDAIAAGVLVKGDPVSAPAGRADDFVWPRGSDAAHVTPPPAAANTMPASAATPSQPKPTAKQPEAKLESTPEPTAARPIAKPAVSPAVAPAAKPARAQANPPKRVEQRQQREAPPRPRQPAQRSSEKLFGPNGPFGWMR
jgi:hypothetical protein